MSHVATALRLLRLAGEARAADAYTCTMVMHFTRELAASEAFYEADPRRIAAACGRLLIAGIRWGDAGGVRWDADEMVRARLLVDMSATFLHETHAHDVDYGTKCGKPV